MKINEEHDATTITIQKEWKEKFEKTRKTLRDEIEYLENSTREQRDSFDQKIRKFEETELHLRRRNAEYDAEVHDLRNFFIIFTIYDYSGLRSQVYKL